VPVETKWFPAQKLFRRISMGDYFWRLVEHGATL
jgi:hypothetical protein